MKEFIESAISLGHFSNNTNITHTYIDIYYFVTEFILLKIILGGNFPGGPGVKTPCSQCRGHGFDPWSGN